MLCYAMLCEHRGAGTLFFPAQFEHDINSTMPHCDFMAYPLSPTHAVPHALAMLPAAPEDVTEEELMYDGMCVSVCVAGYIIVAVI
jgi:hypothetical protein